MTYRMTIIHRVADYSAWEALLRRYPRPTRSGLVRRLDVYPPVFIGELIEDLGFTE